MTKEQLSEVNKGIEEWGLENVENIILIKSGITNGDVIKAMFPYAEYNTYVDVVNRIAMADKDFEIHFDEDWWDTPYQKGDK